MFRRFLVVGLLLASCVVGMAQANLSDTTPAATGTDVNVKFQKDGSGNISGHVPGLPFTQTGTGTTGTAAFPGTVAAATIMPTNPIALANGGTGASTPSAALAALGAAALAPNIQSLYVSQTCSAASPNCIKIFADGKVIEDATSNSTNTVTCPNSDCNFTSADVGKVVWATTASAFISTFVCPQTTITAVNSAQSITIGAACTASGTGNVQLAWGHDDGATLAAMNIGCNVVHLATNGNGNFIFSGQPFFNYGGGVCQSGGSGAISSGFPYLMGDGFGASQAAVVLTPNFNWAGCTVSDGHSHNICIGGAARGIANVQLWGTGLTAASNSNCSNAAGKVVVSSNPATSVMYGVDAAGICVGQPDLVGVSVTSQDGAFDEGGAQDVGQYACMVDGAQTVAMRSNDCMNLPAAGSYGLWVKGGATVYSYSASPMWNVLIDTGSSLTSSTSQYGGYMQPAIECKSGGKFYSYNDIISQQTGAFPAVQIDAGCMHTSFGSSYAGATYALSSAGTSSGRSDTFTGQVLVSGTGAFDAYSDTFSAPVECQSGTRVRSNNDSFWGALTVDSGCLFNTSFSSWAAGAVINNHGTVFSGGGNKLAAIPANFAGGVWQGAGVLFGSCKGTPTASATIGLYGLGQFSTPNCTSTTVNQGVPIQVPISGSLLTLVATSTHVGVNSSDGAVYLTINGVQQAAIGCTIGVGTSCSSSTSSYYIPAAGDVVGVEVVTQAGTTLADITATLLAW